MTAKFLIADFNTGLEKDKEPFLLPQEAFTELEDAYVFRGKVLRKRGIDLFETSAGSSAMLNSRLRINIGTTAAVTGNFAGNAPGILWQVGQIFSVGTTVFTVITAGVAQATLSTGVATATFSTTNGALVITGNNENPTTIVYFYPSIPVMALQLRETTEINFEETVAFDPQFAYQRSGNGWELLGPLYPAANYAQWSYTLAKNFYDFYWTTNYRAANAAVSNLWVVNNRPFVSGGGVAPDTDGIKYIPTNTATWTTVRFLLNSTPAYLETAKIVLSFKNRLLFLSTTEDIGGTDTIYRQRVRWSQNGDPTVVGSLGPYSPGSFADDTPGRGGYLDASTTEQIISAQFVQNRLIVFFERSTWELVYTGNESLPFNWKRINSEMGVESTNSIVGFDDGVIGVGQRGIVIANSHLVQRIDNKIPDLVNDINNVNDGNRRVYGIRDYSLELVYFAYPDSSQNQIFPNKVLVYNYKNNSFAKFNDSFTSLGYFQKTSAVTWDTLEYKTWDDWVDPWDSYVLNAQVPIIITGNQQGFTHLLQYQLGNDSSIYVSNFNTGTQTITAYNHNLKEGAFISLESMNGLANIAASYKISNVAQNSFVLVDGAITGIYTGGGIIEVLDNFNITTKNFMLFADQGQSTYLQECHLLVDQTNSGECTLNIYQDTNDVESLPPLWGIVSGNPEFEYGNKTFLTTIEPNDTFALGQDKIWHHIARPLIGQSFQLEFTLSEREMLDTTIQTQDFVLHAIQMHAQPAGRL